VIIETMLNAVRNSSDVVEFVTNTENQYFVKIGIVTGDLEKSWEFPGKFCVKIFSSF
jgi:hypothetical protein